VQLYLYDSLMTDEAPKSALELAMERLKKKTPKRA
jgi:hypothetical protein